MSNGICAAIGNTKVVCLNRFSRPWPKARLLMKLEFLNPGGSVKARPALNMIATAERQKIISPEKTTLIESSSGNLAIALQMVSLVKGYRFIAVVDNQLSKQKLFFLRKIGATIDLVQGEDTNELKSLRRKRVQELKTKIDNSFVLDQYNNENNSLAHYLTTGPEIYQFTGDELNTVILSVSTGGQALGIGEYLKSKIPKLRLVLVEPAGSQIFSTKKGPYFPAGSGLDYTPRNVQKLQQLQLIDQVYQVTDDESCSALKILATEEGFLPGPSTGLSLFAALLEMEANPHQTLLCVACDEGHGYPEFYNNYPKDNYLKQLSSPEDLCVYIKSIKRA